MYLSRKLVKTVKEASMIMAMYLDWKTFPTYTLTCKHIQWWYVYYSRCVFMGPIIQQTDEGTSVIHRTGGISDHITCTYTYMYGALS